LSGDPLDVKLLEKPEFKKPESLVGGVPVHLRLKEKRRLPGAEGFF